MSSTKQQTTVLVSIAVQQQQQKRNNKIEPHLAVFPFYDFNFFLLFFKIGCNAYAMFMKFDFDLKYSIRFLCKVSIWNNQATEKSCVFFFKKNTDFWQFNPFGIVGTQIHLSSSSTFGIFFNYAWRNEIKRPKSTVSKSVLAMYFINICITGVMHVRSMLMLKEEKKFLNYCCLEMVKIINQRRKPSHQRRADKREERKM